MKLKALRVLATILVLSLVTVGCGKNEENKQSTELEIGNETKSETETEDSTENELNKLTPKNGDIPTPTEILEALCFVGIAKDEIEGYDMHVSYYEDYADTGWNIYDLIFEYSTFEGDVEEAATRFNYDIETIKGYSSIDPVAMNYEDAHCCYTLLFDGEAQNGGRLVTYVMYLHDSECNLSADSEYPIVITHMWQKDLYTAKLEYCVDTNYTCPSNVELVKKALEMYGIGPLENEKFSDL